MTFKGDKCVGGKLAQQWATVFDCANMAETERQLLVTEKYKNHNV